MAEFFKGWRRKTSAMALMMSLFFMAEWIRSFSRQEVVEFRKSKRVYHRLVSSHFGIVWERVQEDDLVLKLSTFYRTETPSPTSPLDDPEGQGIFRIDTLGLAFE